MSIPTPDGSGFPIGGRSCDATGSGAPVATPPDTFAVASGASAGFGTSVGFGMSVETVAVIVFADDEIPDTEIPLSLPS
ncbi:hypothetical protein SDC9_189688 [bioreactor metagenome]|uniref:Uncharacterized protein n=1 Tax=bioreactor metagenome TaxID=1076179 RepID=A0A645HUI4_9ZZZZ